MQSFGCGPLDQFDFKQKRCAKNAVAYNIKGQIIKLDKSKLYGNLRRGILKVKMVFCAPSLAQKYPSLLKYQAFWHTFSTENIARSLKPLI